MYDLQDWAAVQRVYKQTRSKRATAKILGMSRNTVRSLLEEKEAPVYKRTVYKSKIDGFKEQIIEWRCEPFLFNGTRIFRELKARGYTGSIGPVYRYLSKIEEDIKDHISSKATVRHESPPGDQAQFDWSPYNVPVDGVIITVYCFSMILSASRKKAVCFSLKADAAAIYEAIQELFEDLGGVTLELLIDNPTALVIENNPRNEMEIRYNPHTAMVWLIWKQPGKSLTSPHITQERSCCSKNFMIQIPSIVLLDMQYSMILWTSCHLKNCSKLTMQAGCLFLRYLNRDRKFCVKPENTVTMIQNFCGIWITMNRM